MKRSVPKFAFPLLLFGLLVLGFSVSSAFAASPMPVRYQPTPVIVQHNPAPTPRPAPAPVPAPTPAPAGLTADEAALYDLINSARADNNVTPVSINMNAVQAARSKAQDMISNNYFGHMSPTYGSPGQMLNRFGVYFRSAGENIAKVATVYKAHVNFLTSTRGHRENMLNPNFNQVGVGVIRHNGYVVVVEEFVQV